MDFMDNSPRRNSVGHTNSASTATSNSVGSIGQHNANAMAMSNQFSDSSRLAVMQNRNSTGSMAGPLYNQANSIYSQAPMNPYGNSAAPNYGIISEEQSNGVSIVPQQLRHSTNPIVSHQSQPQYHPHQIHPSQQAQMHHAQQQAQYQVQQAQVQQIQQVQQAQQAQQAQQVQQAQQAQQVQQMQQIQQPQQAQHVQQIQYTAAQVQAAHAQTHVRAKAHAQQQSQQIQDPSSPSRNYLIAKTQHTSPKRPNYDESFYNNSDNLDSTSKYSQTQRQAGNIAPVSSENQNDPYSIDSRISSSLSANYPYSPMSSVSPSSPSTSWTSPPLGTTNASTSSGHRTSPLRTSLSQSQQQTIYGRSLSRTPQQLVTRERNGGQDSQLSPHEVHSPQPARSQHSAPSSSSPSSHIYQPPHIQPATIPAPVFRQIRSKSDMSPVIHSQPKYRRAMPEGGFMSPLNALTFNLSSTYQICNPAFNYQSSKNPRRVLTKPSEGKLNNGFDNTDSDYILYVNDILGIDEQRRYLVLDILGQGTFGQVVKCQNMITKEIVAVKVIKNKPAYLNQSMMEVSILEHLNNHVDKLDEHNLLRLKDKFIHKEHLCLVFELLSSNLYELIKQNQFRGLSTNLVRVFTQQLLDSLIVLNEARLIHCDLKPENILLKSLDSPVIKVIDFGSTCHERQTVYTYIQSRFYRSPEVILGLPYTTSIDMWSLGCIVAELFLGLPIFPGTSEYNQLSRITETLGSLPNWMVEMGKNSGQFMEKYIDDFGRKQYRLKSREKYSQEFNTDEQPSKQYFPSTDLRDIIMRYPLPRRNMKKTDIDREMQNRVAFIDFVKGLLNLNPFERWTPQQAAMHPFITETKFNGPFVPNAASRDRNHNIANTHETNATGLASSSATSSLAMGGSSRRYVPSGSNQASTAISSGPPMIKVSGPSQVQQQQSTTSSTQAYYNSGGHPPPQVGQYFQTQSRRNRATTIGQMDSVPSSIQRATSLMDPDQPIRTQPSPAYIPPVDLYRHNHLSTDRGKQDPYGDVVRNLEDGLSHIG